MSSATARPERAEEARNGGTAKKTAFIAAPATADTRALRQALDRLGVHATTIFDADLPARRLSEVVLECVGPADVVIGLLGPGPANLDVVFALGVAHGLGKRVLLLVEEDADAQALASMLGDPYIRARPDNVQAIEFAVTQVLTFPHHGGKQTEEIKKQTHPIDGLADELLAELHGGERPPTEEQLVRMIYRAVKESGVTAASTGKLNDAAVDIAVWSDDLEPWVHNPLLIEVRSQVRSQADVKQIVRQIQTHMEKARVSTALVIHQGPLPAGAQEVNAPQILFISAEDFLESLRHSGFGDVVRRLGNPRAHGTN